MSDRSASKLAAFSNGAVLPVAGWRARQTGVVTVYSRPIPGLVCRDHVVEAPLDHARPGEQTLSVYGREVRSVERAGEDLPWLLFLQGGPGGRAPRPTSRKGWLAEAVKDYRVLLMDQRGTGRSTPVTDRTPSRFPNPASLADYLALFRADAIVGDAEIFRSALAGGAKWTTLGQSYGGLCTLTYLSLAPEGLDKCLITGGLPGLNGTADDVYRRTWPRVIAKNAEHARRFPSDQEILNRLRDAIRSRPPETPIRMPGGDPLTVHRLQALGIVFGMSSGFAEIHYLLEDAFDAGEVSTAFLADVEQRTRHLDAPLYAVLQEVIHCSGTSSRWAAERVRADFPETSPDAANLLLTGEMKESSIFRDEAALRPFAEAMNLLNQKADWPNLYDPDQLARNLVPVAAAIYFDDLYVDSESSLQTAAQVPNLRPWVTNEFEHDGLHSEERVFTHIHDLATGRA
jgi:pimeloyl-ACP methyl ester carboxylesterase